ncbi:adenosylcobinamide-GDP ribazoletransferase [Rugosibacter aromaticivorans]|uniref:adenosylcobinamide-GDP ribazoletransferase n=1 Tax=Rugosibacter aromaticivorans TaxID=1565605 RepID=UPI000A641D2F|nr:adenosylcobinamide-GDP ribazoletransferase [Rugosibacter aromaticivorans]
MFIKIRAQLVYFFAALRFFTRLPTPAWVDHSQDQLNHAARYFPLVGTLVGLIAATVTLVAAMILPVSVAVMFGMAASVLVTGAFHEDGFTDACDGFGGGWDKEHVLTIMKDSRVGSYATVGVALLLLAKWNALVEIDATFDTLTLGLTLVAAHAISRLAATSLIFTLDYVREDATAKAKPLAVRMAPHELLIAALTGLAPCVLLPASNLLVALLAVALCTWLAARYFVRRIGGYTGDCLGATQQIAELAFYLGLLCSFT